MWPFKPKAAERESLDEATKLHGEAKADLDAAVKSRREALDKMMKGLLPEKKEVTHVPR